MLILIVRKSNDIFLSSSLRVNVAIFMMFLLIFMNIVVEGGYYLFNGVIWESSFQKRQSDLSFLRYLMTYLRGQFHTKDIFFLKLFCLEIVFIIHII